MSRIARILCSLFMLTIRIMNLSISPRSTKRPFRSKNNIWVDMKASTMRRKIWRKQTRGYGNSWQIMLFWEIATSRTAIRHSCKTWPSSIRRSDKWRGFRSSRRRRRLRERGKGRVSCWWTRREVLMPWISSRAIRGPTFLLAPRRSSSRRRRSSCRSKWSSMSRIWHPEATSIPSNRSSSGRELYLASSNSLYSQCDPMNWLRRPTTLERANTTSLSQVARASKPWNAHTPSSHPWNQKPKATSTSAPCMVINRPDSKFINSNPFKKKAAAPKEKASGVKLPCRVSRKQVAASRVPRVLSSPKDAQNSWPTTRTKISSNPTQCISASNPQPKS